MRSSGTIYRTVVIVVMAGVTIFSIACGAPSQPSQISDKGPAINYLNAPKQATPSGEIEVTCVASDKNDDKLIYTWTASNGQIKPQRDTDIIIWKAPETIGNGTITVTVSNSRGEKTARSVVIDVTTQLLVYPEIGRIMCSTCPAGEVARRADYTLKCEAKDPGGSPLRYIWLASLGRIKPGEVVPGGAYAEWFTGAQYGSALITVKVINNKGLETEAYLAIPVSCCK